jgi:hypothetical protein
MLNRKSFKKLCKGKTLEEITTMVVACIKDASHTKIENFN